MPPIAWQLVAQGFVPDAALPRFEQVYDWARRLADAAWPEVLLLLLALALGVTTLLGVIPIGARNLQTGTTPAQVWYVVVASPLLQFLLWRSLWRWLIWVRIVIVLSRIKLRLVATHPDRCGGIAFLRLPSVGYCAILLFVASSLLCAELGGRYDFGTSLMSFKPFILMFAIVGAAIAFGPLLFFTPHLVRARLDGTLECDGLAAEQGWRFRRLWVEDRRPLPSHRTRRHSTAWETFTAIRWSGFAMWCSTSAMSSCFFWPPSCRCCR